MEIYSMTPVKRNSENIWEETGTPHFFANQKVLIKRLGINVDEQGNEIKESSCLHPGLVYQHIGDYNRPDAKLYEMFGFTEEYDRNRGYRLQKVYVDE